MLIKTSDSKTIEPFFERMSLPKHDSHKGQNGKVLIIGGSTLFHSASLWAAEVASHFADMVHYSSTEENEEIFLSLKKKFHNGIVVPKKNLLEYVEEDDAILVGPGMVRGDINEKLKIKSEEFEEILKTKDEAEFTYGLTYYLIKNFPEKRFVFDAGALQMMEPEWLSLLKTKAIVTPHQGEFNTLFRVDLKEKTLEQKAEIAREMANKNNCIILLKAITDIVTDGEKINYIEGGNQGLTKGGTGDILAGLTVSFFAKSSAVESCIMSSYLLKSAADSLFKQKAYWYNVDNLVDSIPDQLAKLTLLKN